MLKEIAARIRDDEDMRNYDEKIDGEYEESVVGMSNQEIKFVNLIQLILDGGWCIDEVSYADILILSGAQNQLQELGRYYCSKLQDIQHLEHIA